MYKIEFEQEDDGRWIAEINALPGVMVYADSKQQALIKVEALALSACFKSPENQFSSLASIKIVF